MDSPRIWALLLSDHISIGMLALPIQLPICNFILCLLSAVHQFSWLLKSLEACQRLFLSEDLPSDASSYALPEFLFLIFVLPNPGLLEKWAQALDTGLPFSRLLVESACW